MLKTIGGLLGAIFVGVVTWWLTEGLRTPAPAPMPTSPPVGASPHTPSTNGSTGAAGGIVQVVPPVRRREVQYKLVWYNHFEKNKLYEVLHTDASRKEVRNDEFRQWCTPFDPNLWIVHESREIAGDEHWKEDGERLTHPPYNLPRLNERWFQIMDDEKWYLYAVEAR